MKLLLKFNLVLILVFAVGIGIARYFSREFLERNAQEQVLQQARLMMGAVGGMRIIIAADWPMLEAQQWQLNVPEILPETVPDQISDLARTFNRMYLSMVKTMRMLRIERARVRRDPKLCDAGQ